MDKNEEKMPLIYEIDEVLIKVSAGLGLVYTLYLFYVFYSSYSENVSILTFIGISLVARYYMPHIICTILAVVLNILSIFVDCNGLLLASAILYTIAIIVLPGIFYWLLLSTIIMYVSFFIFSK